MACYTDSKACFWRQRMARRKLSKAQQAFGSGRVIEQLVKQEVRKTEFEAMLNRLGLTEITCTESAEAIAWVSTHRNSCFIRERVLRALQCGTLYDDGDIAPYSLTECGMIIEPLPKGCPMRSLRKKQLNPDPSVVEMLKEAEATPESKQTASKQAAPTQEPVPRISREHHLTPPNSALV